MLNGSGTKVQSIVIAQDNIKRDIVESTSDYASNLKASADFNF